MLEVKDISMTGFSRPSRRLPGSLVPWLRQLWYIPGRVPSFEVRADASPKCLHLGARQHLKDSSRSSEHLLPPTPAVSLGRFHHGDPLELETGLGRD